MAEPEEPKVQAGDNSNAVGNINVGGNVGGDIHIGNTTNVYQYESAEDVRLSNEEIENGLTRLAEYLPERAPVMLASFDAEAKNLRAVLGPDPKSLSTQLRRQYEDGIDRMKLLCLEVLDISFHALCNGETPPPYDSRPPFLGLFAFKPQDREFFFGRDALVEKLVARLKDFPFLAVVGASGSGKSSLVMAGIVPALEAPFSYFTPSFAPLLQLESAKSKSEPGTVFVVDQFEELFTLTLDEKERGDFIQKLIETTKTNRVIITMRADFWGEVAAYADLKQLMQDHQELIAPMDAEELRDAASKQAEVVGLRFDPALSELIVEEVRDQPGAMPLFQHALWILWQRRHGLWLKADEYRAFGGIQRAIASTADEMYEKFSPEDRERMHNVFVRLTRLDDSGNAARDTRKRVNLKDLVYRDDTTEQTAEFVRRLADARLLITSSEKLIDQEVEVAHEALIRNWDRLRNWLNEDRLTLLVHENIREATSVWESSDRDKDALTHRGGRLEDALHLSRNPTANLAALEFQYLEVCKKIERGFSNRLARLISRLPIPIVASWVIILAILLLLPPNPEIPIAISIGTLIPLLTLFILSRKDKYRAIELKWYIFCVMGGVITYYFAAQINPTLLNSGAFSRSLIITVLGPIVENSLKAAALIFILRNIKLSRSVDGIVFGAAVGTGFAIFGNYEYRPGNQENAIFVAITMALSENLIHMAATGLADYMYIKGRFDRNRYRALSYYFLAFLLPILPNIGFNIYVNTGGIYFYMIIIGLTLIFLLAKAIRHLNTQEQKWIDNITQSDIRTSNSNELRQVTISIRNLFGLIRASQFDRFLSLRANLGILLKTKSETENPALLKTIDAQLTTIRKKLRGTRGAIGNYCWENVKNTIPELSHLTEDI